MTSGLIQFLSVNLLVSQIQPHPTRCLSALKHFVNLFTKGHIQLSKRNTVFDRLGSGRVLLEMSMLGISCVVVKATNS